MDDTDNEWKSPFGFNTIALRNEDARVGDMGPDSICGPRGSAHRKKTTFEILDSLVKQKEAVLKIFCSD